MRVAVYFNIRRRLFSVKALEGPNKGRVIAHLPSLSVSAATFKVSEAGRQRVLRTGQKNVHAYVVGLSGTQRGTAPFLKNLAKGEGYYRLAVYNPRRDRTFIDLGTGTKLDEARFVDLDVIDGHPVISYSPWKET